MSLKSAKDYIHKILTDEEFAKKILSFEDDESHDIFIKSEGYEFTNDELNSAKMELSDEQLDQISGTIYKGSPQNYSSNMKNYLMYLKNKHD